MDLADEIDPLAPTAARANSSPAKALNSSRGFAIAAAAVLLLGLIIRLNAVGTALPYVGHPDEPRNLRNVQAMVLDADANPHAFRYPSLWYYSQAPGQLGLKLYRDVVSADDSAARRLGRVVEQSAANAYSTDESSIKISRLMNVAIGVGAIVAGMLLAWRLCRNRYAALLTGFLLALNPILLKSSSIATPDILAALTTTAAILLILPVMTKVGVRQYALAGIGIGLAAASKYNCGIVAAGLVAAHFAGSYRSGVRRSTRMLGVAFAAAIATFIVAMPYSVLDFSAFWDGLTAEIRHYSNGHPGFEGLSAVANFEWLIKSLGPLLLAIFLVRSAAPRSPEAIVMAVMTLSYLAMISVPEVRFERNLLPIIPSVVAIGASLVAATRDEATLRRRQIGVGIAAVAVLFAVVVGAEATQELGTDSRASAREWIDDNVVEGARVLVESYSPYVDPDRFQVRTERYSLAHPELLRATETDVVIVTAAGSERNMDHLRDDGQATDSLDDLRETSCRRKSFNSGSKMITIYFLNCDEGVAIS